MKNFKLFFLFLPMVLMACGSNSNALFEPVSKSHSNIDFRNLILESEDFNIFKYQYFYNGGGVAIADFNNDGLKDVVFTGNFVKNRIYKNTGNLEFKDMTVQSTISDKGGWSTGVTTVDINEDGLLDIYICRAGFPFEELRSNLLYINQGDFKFKESAKAYGLDDFAYSTKASFFDYDQDGDLDVFIVNHSEPDYSKGNLEIVQLRQKIKPEFGSKLFANDSGKFREVTKESGITSNVLSFSLDVAVGDINNDLLPDLYVTNDFNEPDYLFVNIGNGKFQESGKDYFDHMSLFSMGVDISDLNNDGAEDVITMDMLPEGNFANKMHSGADNFNKSKFLQDNNFNKQYSRNMLHLNQGANSFKETGQAMNVSATDWSWSALFLDFDNDGFQDIFISNGYLRDHTDMDFLQFTADEVMRIDSGKEPVTFTEYIATMPPINEKNYFYKNSKGSGFENIGTSWESNKPGVSQGAAYGDLDNDGDLDLVLNNSDTYGQILENKSDNSVNGFLRLSFEGMPRNTNGIGAKVNLYADGNEWNRHLYPSRGFQSSVENVIHFGIGNTIAIDSMIVTWPDESIKRYLNVERNQSLVLQYSDARKEINTKGNSNDPLAVKMEGVINYDHIESSFNDFDHQQLLPFHLSHKGPSLASADLNEDGLHDIIIGGGTGQSSVIAYQLKNGSFSNIELGDINAECVDILVEDFNGDKKPDIYMANGSYEQKADDTGLADRIYFNLGNKKWRQEIVNMPLSYSSCVAGRDVDSDGDIDLFVASYVERNQFPKSPDHYILINNGLGKFTVQEDATSKLNGMITDALWNEQGELVVVGEWMPISIFEYRDGILEETLITTNLDTLKGYFKMIEQLDWEDDGDLDYVVGNLGINSIFNASSTYPMQLHYGDMDKNGSVDPIISNWNVEGKFPIYSKEDLVGQLPALKKKFTSFSNYANATSADFIEILGVEPEVIDSLEINELHHLLIRNEKEGYRVDYLSNDLQMAPLYAIKKASNLGLLFTGGNESIARVKIGSLVGNHGEVVSVDSKGHDQIVNNSGIKLKGDVRDIETIPYQDGYLVIYAISNEKVETYFISTK